MTGVAVVLAGVAVVLGLAPAPGRGWERRLGARPAAPTAGRARLGGRRAVLVTVASLSPVLAGGVLLGRPGAVVALCLVLVAGTVAVVAAGHRSRRAADQRAGEVARACAVLAAELRIGRVPAEALTTAAEDAALLSTVAAVQRSGGDVVRALRELSVAPGAAGLAPVANAWQVAARTGAPLTQALDRVSSALKAERAVHRVVATELSAPRATGRMLALLPLVGLLLGFAIGGDPVGFLLRQWQGQLCLVLGVLLACAGVLWSERLAR